MKQFLFDLFPVIVFFVAFKMADIYVATATAIGATILQVGWLKLKRKRVDPMLWAGLGLIVVFGGATLALRDETFIKWKPTILYWLFSAMLAGSELFFRRNLIRGVLGAQGVQLPDPIWRKLNWAWVAFFAFMGVANLYVALSFDTDMWVNFKLFGGTGLMLLFMIAQVLVVSRYMTWEDGPGTKP
jgi:intracellular septation protein